MKAKHIIVLAAVLLLLVIGSIVGGIVVLNSPENIVVRSIPSAAIDLFGRDEIAPFCRILSRGSIQASIRNVKKNDKNWTSLNHLSGKLYFSDDALMLTDFDAKFFKSELAGEVYIDPDTFYANEKKILRGAYGIRMNNLADDLAGSIFAADSGSDYAMDQKSYNALMERLNGSAKSKKFKKDLTELIEAISKDIWRIVMDNVTITSKNATPELNGEKINAKMTTVSLDFKSIQYIVIETHAYFGECEKIKAFIEAHEDTLILLLGENYDKEKHGSLAEAYEKWLNGMEEGIKELFQNIYREIKTAKIKINIFTPAWNAKLLKLEITVGGETSFSLDCGPKGIKNADIIRMQIAETEINYEVRTKDKKKLGASLTIRAPQAKIVETTELSFLMNQKKDTYTATYRYTQEFPEKDSHIVPSTVYQYTARGSIETKWDTTTLTADEIKHVYREYNGYSETSTYETVTVYTLDCSFVLDTRDRMPKPMKNYKTIADITEEELHAWIKAFQRFS